MIEAELLKRVLPYVVAVLIVGGALFGAYAHGYSTAAEHWKLIVAQINDANRAEVIALQQKAQEIEQAHAQQIATIDQQHQEAIQNEKAKLDAAIAAYNAGALRLRDKFTCHAASKPNVPDTSTGTGSGDAASEGGLQREDVQFLISEASRADQVADQLKACQAVIAADRAQ
jgi:prophage endopeptidase